MMMMMVIQVREVLTGLSSDTPVLLAAQQSDGPVEEAVSEMAGSGPQASAPLGGPQNPPGVRGAAAGGSIREAWELEDAKR